MEENPNPDPNIPPTPIPTVVVAPISSPIGEINRAELKQWQKNLIKFLIPLALLYGNQVTGALQYGGFDYTYSNLAVVLLPTAITVGGMILYLMNGITDFLSKYLGGNRVA